MTVSATVTCHISSTKGSDPIAEDVPCFGCWILRNKSGPEMSPCELAAIVPDRSHY